MAGYVYRGAQLDAKPTPGPKPGKEDPELCGSNPGVWRHRYRKEKNCPKCRDFVNAQRRESYRATKGQPPKVKRLETIEKIQKAEKLFSSGASLKEVQRKTGMTQATIRRHLPEQCGIKRDE